MTDTNEYGVYIETENLRLRGPKKVAGTDTVPGRYYLVERREGNEWVRIPRISQAVFTIEAGGGGTLRIVQDERVGVIGPGVVYEESV